MPGGDKRAGGRTIVFPTVPFVHGGAVENFPIPSGVDLINVSVAPERNACPRTTIRIAVRNKSITGQGFQLVRGICYAIGNTPFSYTWFGEIPLSGDYEWELNVLIYNQSGVTLNFTINATVREGS